MNEYLLEDINKSLERIRKNVLRMRSREIFLSLMVEQGFSRQEALDIYSAINEER
jgi:hypothetical protein